MITAEARDLQARDAGGRVWLPATITAAVLATIVEAALLQQKKAFFTGGFLAATQATRLPEALTFIGVSLLVDASLVGLTAALLMALTARARLTRVARFVLVTAGAVAPLVIWDFVTYSLLAYLGDAFDFGLMFDLVGRKPGEILAVTSAHMAAPIALTAASAAGLGALVWLLNRFSPGSRTSVVVSRRLPIGAFGLCLVGLLTAAIASGASDTLEDGLRRKPSGNIYGRVTALLTDVDRDGFGIGGRTSDPDPFNGAIYPYALEVVGNGIDEDGAGGDLPSAEPAYREDPASVVWRRKPDVVLIVLESFRADTIGRLVNGTPVTPVLDGLGREGVSSSRAFSHNGYTIQSRYHLLTGSLVGLRQDGSIIDDFKRRGYQTAYFSAQDESFGGPDFAVGFDRADVAYDARQDRGRRYTTFSTAGSLAVSHKTLRENIDRFLASRDRSKPLFLYVNFHDTHYPYRHSDIVPIVSGRRLTESQIGPARQDELHEMYLNTAANVDRAVGATLAAVTSSLGRLPAVIVTADHGESLFDEGFLGHGYALNEAQTRIPLVVRGLPLNIEEPFAQIELRDAIGEALSSSCDGDDRECRPRLRANPAKAIFQYLGDIGRPRQIAFVGPAGRLIYDFRARSVRLPDGRAVAPEALDSAAGLEFRQLIHLWERMKIARSAHRQLSENK